MAKSLSDLSKHVLQDLRVIDALESPSAEDHDLVSGRYTMIYEALVFEDMAWWEESAIPEVVFLPVCSLVALHTAPAFGPVNMTAAQMESEETAIKRRIRRVSGKKSSGLAQAVEDF